MPLISVDVFKDELSEAQSADLIAKITDAVATVTSEKLRPHTWVIIREVKDGRWGIGGTPLTLANVKAIVAEGMNE